MNDGRGVTGWGVGDVAQTVILRGLEQRALACQLVKAAPTDAVVTIKEGTRSLEQNALLWSILSQVSRAKPEGRKHPPEVWKNLFMHACGYAVQFEMGLNGQPFPVGFRSSRLTKSQFSELMEFVFAWCAERGIPVTTDVQNA